MKILVCIKQISTSEIHPHESANWIAQQNVQDQGINPFDEYALEEAVLIKERYPDVSVDVISVGPDIAVESIRRAMGMGADRGIHVVTEDQGYVTGFVTASRIAATLRPRDSLKSQNLPHGSYDMILTGVMSEDLMQGQVGPMLAEILAIPCVTSVVQLQCSDTMNGVTVQREMEGGLRQEVRASMPLVLTIQAGINKPRYPSLSNILRAGRKKIFSCRADELFLEGAPDSPCLPSHGNRSSLHGMSPVNSALISLERLEYPVKKREAQKLGGTTEQKAALLMDILKQRDLI